MGKPGRYKLEYHPVENGQYLQPIITFVDVADKHCVTFTLSNPSPCRYDPFTVSWTFPEDMAAESDWMGFHNVIEGSVSSKPVHWLYLSGDQLNKVKSPKGTVDNLRISAPGEYEIRLYGSAKQAMPSTMLAAAKLTVRQNTTCGLYLHQFSAFGAPHNLEAIEAASREQSLELLHSPTAFHGDIPYEITHATLPAVGVQGGVTVSLWALVFSEDPKRLSGHRTLFYKGLGGPDRTPSLFMSPNGYKLTLRVSTAQSKDEGVASTTALTPHKWHHLAMVVNKSHIMLYIDGSLAAGPSPTKGEVLHNDGSFFFGATPSKSIPGFRGTLSRVRFHNWSLNQSRVQSEMETTQPPPNTPVGHSIRHSLDEGLPALPAPGIPDSDVKEYLKRASETVANPKRQLELYGTAGTAEAIL